MCALLSAQCHADRAKSRFNYGVTAQIRTPFFQIVKNRSLSSGENATVPAFVYYSTKDVIDLSCCSSRAGVALGKESEHRPRMDFLPLDQEDNVRNPFDMPVDILRWHQSSLKRPQVVPSLSQGFGTYCPQALGFHLT